MSEKNKLTQQKIEYWVIPPEADAEFAAGMEEVLAVYERSYDPANPVVCMDEQPVQLTKETRTPIPATKDHAKRVDYEYERNGTASIFCFNETLVSWRQVTARPRRTKVDWAEEVGRLLRERYAHCESVTLVCDNLSTHTRGAFYEAFDPAKARSCLEKLRFCHTPKHGSWLNIAECELACLTKQCLSHRRIGTLAKLKSEVAAWSEATNRRCRDVHWQFRIDEARTKLASLDPKFQD